jgi:Helix-turn-helix domain
MANKYITAVWGSKDVVEHSSLLILLALADFANDEGWSWPAIAKLAEMARISDRHARRLLRRLEVKKVVEIEHRIGRNNTNRYRLTLTSLCPVLPEEKGTSGAIKADIMRPVLLDEKGTSGTQKGTPRHIKADIRCPMNHQEPSIKSNQKQKQVVEIPDWVPKKAWADFVEMRNRAKKPMTDAAAMLIIGRLEAFRSRGHPPREVLENSTMNSWQGVYEPKGKGNGLSKDEQRDRNNENVLAKAFGRDAESSSGTLQNEPGTVDGEHLARGSGKVLGKPD